MRFFSALHEPLGGGFIGGLGMVTMSEPKPPRVTLTARRRFEPDEARQLRAAAIAAVVVDADRAVEARTKPLASPDRASVKRAMEAVEARLVEAIWTLARLPDREKGWLHQTRHGLDYIEENRDRWANAVNPAPGKAVGFDPVPMRPAPPTARAIDRMYAPLTWLQQLDRRTALVVYWACASMRGDSTANISWDRVKSVTGVQVTRQRLAQIYAAGLRTIVAGRA